MKNIIFISLVLLSVTSIFISACGKSDSSQSTINHQPSTDSSLSTDNQQLSTINLVHNGNFEEGVEKPEGWTTKNQFLNDVTGWDTEVTHNSTHSLKIENIGGTAAYWQGKPIIITEPANALDVSIWTKTGSIAKSDGQFYLHLGIYFRDDSGNETSNALDFVLPKVGQNWEQSSNKCFLAKNIVRIVPYIYFSGNIGVAYIDNFSICATNIDFTKGNLLFDSNTNGTFAKNVQIISDKDGQKILEVIGSQNVISSDFIPVETNRTYKLSGLFKSKGKESSKLYFGYAPYTHDKKLISRIPIKYVKNTETKVLQACTKSDTELYVDNALKWVPDGYIAFGVDDSGKYSDLPNFNLSPKITSVSKQGESWKVVLSQPCGIDYPTNTKIREHIDDGVGQYLYKAAKADIVPNEWTEFSSINSYDQLYPGTAYVKIIALCNYGQTKDESLIFKDIKLQETNP